MPLSVSELTLIATYFVALIHALRQLLISEPSLFLFVSSLLAIPLSVTTLLLVLRYLFSKVYNSYLFRLARSYSSDTTIRLARVTPLSRVATVGPSTFPVQERDITSATPTTPGRQRFFNGRQQ
jgi:hypothetical protein